MAGARLTIARRVRSLLGPTALVDMDGRGIPRVAPPTTDACALLLQAAAEQGWRVRVAGRGGWAGQDAPADLVLTTAGFARVLQVSTPDLVATVEGGVRWTELRRALADHGAWLAVDPPGTDRSLGSIVAAGVAGPLRTGFGPIRDHLLGLTLVTGDGRIVRPGGRVVKNVAGFDLTRLASGSFGAFGVVTAVHLRLRAVPRADLTLVATGERDELVQRGLAIRAAGEPPAALELTSPGASGRDRWTLGVRLLGSEAAVDEARRAVAAAGDTTFEELPPAAAADYWLELAAGTTRRAVTLRLGAVPAGLSDALDLVTHHLDDGWLTASLGAATVRWCGRAPIDRVRLLRAAAAQREVPLTLERGPWDLLSTLGHYGAYRDGVGRLVGGLRRVFDPQGVLVVPLGEG